MIPWAVREPSEGGIGGFDMNHHGLLTPTPPPLEAVCQKEGERGRQETDEIGAEDDPTAIKRRASLFQAHISPQVQIPFPLLVGCPPKTRGGGGFKTTNTTGERGRDAYSLLINCSFLKRQEKGSSLFQAPIPLQVQKPFPLLVGCPPSIGGGCRRKSPGFPGRNHPQGDAGEFDGDHHDHVTSERGRQETDEVKSGAEDEPMATKRRASPFHLHISSQVQIPFLFLVEKSPDARGGWGV